VFREQKEKAFLEGKDIKERILVLNLKQI